MCSRSLSCQITFVFPAELFKTTFATFGGFEADGETFTDKVTLVNMETQKTCIHSTLPVAMKETYIYDYKETLLVCSARTEGDSAGNLKCFEWDASATEWKAFSIPPPENGLNGATSGSSFISSARLPGKYFSCQKETAGSYH